MDYEGNGFMEMLNISRGDLKVKAGEKNNYAMQYKTQDVTRDGINYKD